MRVPFPTVLGLFLENSFRPVGIAARAPRSAAMLLAMAFRSEYTGAMDLPWALMAWTKLEDDFPLETSMPWFSGS